MKRVKKIPELDDLNDIAAGITEIDAALDSVAANTKNTEKLFNLQ